MGKLTVSAFPVIVAEAGGQLVLALVLAAMLERFYRLHGRRYLRHWVLSWLALAVYLVGGLTSGRADTPQLDVGTFVFAVALVASYFQIVWLLVGTWEHARGTEARPRNVELALVLAAAVALVTLHAPLLFGLGYRSALTARCLTAALAYGAAALLLLRRRSATMGRSFAAVALALYAVDQLAYFALGFASRSEQLQGLPALMAFDIVATALIGLALVVWLLEGERARLIQAGELARQRERAQACVYAISEATRTVRDLPQLVGSIHETLKGVLPARNFYVAMLDRKTGWLEFPYFVDEVDPPPPSRPLGRGLTEYVLRTGRPLLATPERVEELLALGEVDRAVRGRVDWLGAPLLSGGRVIGVAAIQTHDPALRLGDAERDLFIFVSEQIAAAIEAKRTEEALRESEARLRLTVEQLPAVLWTTDEQLRFVTSVGAGLRGLALEPQQVVGMSVAEYVGSDHPVLAAHERALAGESVSCELEMAGRMFLVHVEPLRDLNGATRGTIGIGLDVSETRQAHEALRRSEACLRQVIDLVPHFIFAKDEAGRFVLANQAVAEAYGTTVDELIGRSDAEFARSPAQVEAFQRDDREVIRTGRARLISEEPITDSGGRLRVLQTTKIPFAFGADQRPAVLGISIDITERKATEEALRKAAKDESLTVLAGGVAHDFNNLLAAILGQISLGLVALPEGSAARRHVEKAAAAVERASDLTRQMLAYSGRGHFVVRPTDLNALVRENLRLFETAAPKSVRLRSELCEDLPPIEADVGQMQQLLMNLVINATEAIGDRNGTVTIATGTREVGRADGALWRASGQALAPGRYVVLEVRDDGPGMSAETVERVFEPFFTTKFTGRGLGLAAVLGVVRGHRGALSVESAPGQGTTFRLLFAPSSGKPDGGARDEGRVDTVRGLTLLLIDDEEIVREMVSEALRAEGLRVLAAADGASGVVLFEAHAREIDVVLLDLSMPGLSGEATFARLREITPGVRVILSSGYDHDEALRRFGADGPAGFIQKPYRPQQLTAAIERCLREAPAR